MSKLSVVIVDDHAMFRTGVRAEIHNDVDVLADAEDVDTAVAAIMNTARMWCCSTCICPAVAAPKLSAGFICSCPKQNSSHCR